MDNIKILIAVHKECELPESEMFLPIQVGRAKSSVKLNMQGDDDGDNISNKNSNYCELTALYWAWKNLKDLDYIGLNHYRRFFSYKNKFQHSTYLSEDDFLLRKNEIKLNPNWKKDLEKFDIIKVKPFTYYHCIQNVLTNILSTDDLDLLENVIKRSHPDYYDTYIQYMKYNNKISSCNMFLCRFELFDDYCKWLFGVLFELEKLVHISQYSTAARIFGFLSEALFNIYCIQHNLKIKYYSIDVVRDDVIQESHLVYYLKNLRRNISFLFNKPKSLTL